MLKFFSAVVLINAKDENGETPLDLISEKNLQGNFMKISWKSQGYLMEIHGFKEKFWRVSDKSLANL